MLPGAAGGIFSHDPATGDAALITSVPDAIGTATDAETVASAELREDAIEYFPEAVIGERSHESEPGSAERSTDASPRQTVELFDENTWRSELTGLTDEQADEVIAIRKRLGAVAAQSLGVAVPSFPELPDAPDAASAEPGRFPFSTISQMQPAIALAESGRPQSAVPASEEPDRSVQATGFVPESLATGSRNDVLKGSVSLDVVRRTNAAAERFRSAIQRVRLLNLRNRVTPGFKRSELVIVNVAAQTDDYKDDRSDNAHNSDGEGELITWLERIDTRQGELLETNNPFDVAIEGGGWLQVEHDGHNLLTRVGILCLTDRGLLGVQTQRGQLPLVPAVRVSELPSGALVIAEDGTVSTAVSADDEESVESHSTKIVIVDVPNAAALKRVDGGLFQATHSSGQPFETRGARLRQGQLEQSNVTSDSPDAETENLLRLADVLTTTLD
jgi:flagellar basal body rod protein FlgG